MANDRISPPIEGIAAFRDRPFELNRFDRIEAARRGGDRPPPQHRRPPPPRPAPTTQAPTADAALDPDDRPLVGTKLDVVG